MLGVKVFDLPPRPSLLVFNLVVVPVLHMLLSLLSIALLVIGISLLPLGDLLPVWCSKLVLNLSYLVTMSNESSMIAAISRILWLLLLFDLPLTPRICLLINVLSLSTSTLSTFAASLQIQLAMRHWVGAPSDCIAL